MGCPFVIKNHMYYECVNGTQKKTDNDSTVSIIILDLGY